VGKLGKRGWVGGGGRSPRGRLFHVYSARMLETGERGCVKRGSLKKGQKWKKKKEKTVAGPNLTRGLTSKKKKKIKPGSNKNKKKREGPVLRTMEKGGKKCGLQTEKAKQSG